MEPTTMIQLMKTINELKDVTRHSWSKKGRHESVAEHTYSMMAAAYFLHAQYPETDLAELLTMCLFHDIGEAFTGDIPSFDKTNAHELKEQECIQQWLAALPQELRPQLDALFEEMDAMETMEAKLYKAIDKSDVLLMHNEADIATWIPLEYELNLTYGEEQMQFSPYMQAYREAIKADTQRKIAQSQKTLIKEAV